MLARILQPVFRGSRSNVARWLGRRFWMSEQSGSRVSSGYGSIGNGRRSSWSVRFDDGGEESQNAGRRPGNRSAVDSRNRATGRLGIRFDEGRSSSEEEFEIRRTDSWSRLPRRGSASRSPEAHAGNYPRTRVGTGFGLMKSVRDRVRIM